MKRVLILSLLLLALAVGLPAQTVGGGVSVFLPESLYRDGEGSVSVETALQTSFGLGEFLSFPIGVSYNQIYGLKPAAAELGAGVRPWFYADNIQPFLMAQLRVGIDRFYVDVFGGGALSWNPVIRPLTKNIEGDLASIVATTEDSSISFVGDPAVQNSLGYGWLAGGGFGLNIQGVDIDLNATYKSMTHGVVITGDYYEVPSGTETQSFSSNSKLSNFRVLLRGLTIGINGAIAM